MAFHYRRNIVFTPASIANVSDEDDEDYIQDPEQIRDIAPQPYRMINKIIDGIYDGVWDIVEEIERTRLAKQIKITKSPKYDCAVECQNEIQGKASSLISSGDGRYIFIGLPNGLAAMDASTQSHIDMWEESAEIVTMTSYIIGVQTYLIITLDDMGVCRLFLFAFDNLFMLKVINEQELPQKNLVQKCEASQEGDYMGVVLENTTTKAVWLEIHKLPRDAWLRELEAVLAHFKQAEKEQEDCAESPAEGEATEPHSPEEKKIQKKQSVLVKKKKKRAGSPTTTVPSQPGAGGPGNKSVYKFSASTIVLKVTPPPKIAASISPTFAACQKVDTGEVIGTGQGHILTAYHMEGRDEMFDHMHENLVKYLGKDNTNEQRVVSPSFHFLHGNHIPVFGLEQAAQTALAITPSSSQPSMVAVWWSDGTHVMQYSLLKTGKELEHKPDIVWPLSCRIKSSAVSPCTALIALGLENGTVVLWDRYMGIIKAVITVSPDIPVDLVKFLDPSVPQQATQTSPPYRIKGDVRLLIQCRTGAEFLFNTAEGRYTPPVCLSPESMTDEEMETVITPMPDIPELLLVMQQTGSLFLKDVLTGCYICEIVIPNTHEIPNTWEPVTAFGAGGQFLYVKGCLVKPPTPDLVECETVEESNEKVDESEDVPAPSPKPPTSSLFMFPLRSFPTLDPYWQRTREASTYLVHTTLEQRIEALMTERLAQQALRKPRMQMRWGMLRQELDIIQQSKFTSRKSLALRAVISASTYKSADTFPLV